MFAEPTAVVRPIVSRKENKIIVTEFPHPRVHFIETYMVNGTLFSGRFGATGSFSERWYMSLARTRSSERRLLQIFLVLRNQMLMHRVKRVVSRGTLLQRQRCSHAD